MATILIVDDDMDAGSIARDMVSKHNRVILARSAEEALQVLKAEAVSVLITDVRMPGMDGFSLAEAARHIQPGIPVVVISAYYDDSDDTAQLMARRHADVVLTKPFGSQELNEAIRRLTITDVPPPAATATA